MPKPYYLDLKQARETLSELGIEFNERQMQRAAEKYGVATLKAAMKQLQKYTERIVRNSIAEIPDGDYSAEDYAGTDGISEEPIRMKVTLKVRGTDIIVDFAGSDPTCKGAINSPFANTASAVFYSLQFFLAPWAPQNQGMFTPIQIELPEDCWLNAKWPSPTIGCTTLTSSKITSAIWQALAKASPDKVTGSTSADCNWFVSSVTAPDGTTDVFSDLPAGGWGASPYADGMNVTEDALGNCMNMPAESAELLFPIAYEAFELRQDSGGAGQYRGGLGANGDYRLEADEATLQVRADRHTVQPFGLYGGSPGAPSENWSNPHLGDAAELLPSKPTMMFRKGDVFRHIHAGGGGWGDPLERDPAAVLQDVRNEFLSAEKAAADYGVIVDTTAWQVDTAATTRQREELRRQRAWSEVPAVQRGKSPATQEAAE